MRVQVGNKEFDVKISTSFDESKVGLSQTEKLPKGEGFAMKLEPAVDVPITMQGMKFPIDVIFILNNKVVKVVKAKPDQEDIIIGKPSDLVIEVNSGEAEGIKSGNTVEFIGKKNEDGTVEIAEGGIKIIGDRQVLDENGKNQMNLLGGERIFSRIATAKMFELARAKEYLKLGKFVVEEIEKQDTRPPEYAAN